MCAAYQCVQTKEEKDGMGRDDEVQGKRVLKKRKEKKRKEKDEPDETDETKQRRHRGTVCREKKTKPTKQRRAGDDEA